MAKLPPCTFVSWRTVQRLSRDLARVILASGFVPDILVAIGRGASRDEVMGTGVRLARIARDPGPWGAESARVRQFPCLS